MILDMTIRENETREFEKIFRTEVEQPMADCVREKLKMIDEDMREHERKEGGILSSLMGFIKDVPENLRREWREWKERRSLLRWEQDCQEEDYRERLQVVEKAEYCNDHYDHGEDDYLALSVFICPTCGERYGMTGCQDEHDRDEEKQEVEDEKMSLLGAGYLGLSGYGSIAYMPRLESEELSGSC